MEVSRELSSTYLGWLQSTWKTMWEKALLEMTHHVGMWRKRVPNRTHPDSSMNFGVGLVQLGVTSQGGKRRYPSGNAPCLHEEMSPCTVRLTLQDCWVQDSGAFLGLPNPQVLPLISLSCHHLPKGWGYPWQGDHS